MAKWQHLRLTTTISPNFNQIVIFPSSTVNMEWLFNKFTRIKKIKNSDSTVLFFEVKEGESLLFVEEAILHYLEENGWEAYSFNDNNGTYGLRQTTAFKRQVA